MKQTSLQVYQGLNTADFESIKRYFSKQMLDVAKIREYKNNEYITQATKPLDHLFFLLQGRAKIYLTHENGKKNLLQFLSIGDFIGDLTVVGAEKVSKDVLAIGKTVCLAIPIKEIQKSEGIFFKKLAQYIGEKLLMRMEHF